MMPRCQLGTVMPIAQETAGTHARHIIEHEDIGMMGMWHIMGEPMPMS